MKPERSEKFNPVKIAIGAFVVLVIVVVVVAVVSVFSGNSLVAETDNFAHGYDDGDNSEEKKAVLSELSKMRELFKKNIRAQVTITPTTNKTFPNYVVTGNYVSATSRSYGFKLENIKNDVLKKIDSDIATFTNQVGLNGFHEYANVDYASEINFANSDNTVVCSVPRMANSDYTVSCASVKWYDAENKQVIEAIASALPKPDKITYYKTSKDDIIDSPVSGYQRMIASTVDGMAMFYRASGGSWFYFKTVQGLPVCDDFKTDVLKKAFYGMECRQLGNGVTTKVGI